MRKASEAVVVSVVRQAELIEKAVVKVEQLIFQAAKCGDRQITLGTVDIQDCIRDQLRKRLRKAGYGVEVSPYDTLIVRW